MAEWLLDDHAAPGIARLAGHVGTAEPIDDGPEVPVRDRQVEEHVAIDALLRALLGEEGFQLVIDLGPGEIPRQEGHASRQPVPGLVVDASAWNSPPPPTASDSSMARRSWRQELVVISPRPTPTIEKPSANLPARTRL